MTLQQIEAVLREVRCPLHVFHAAEDDGMFWLWAACYSTCAATGAPQRRLTGRHAVDRFATAFAVVQTALRCVLWHAESEARAAFTYQGRPLC